MTDTQTLIEHLSRDTVLPKAMRSPRYWVVLLLAVLAVYGIAAQLFLGLRPDLVLQLSRPLFVAEIGLLATLLLTSVIASVLAMYPDSYQQPKLLRLPYVAFMLLATHIAFQLLMPLDIRMVMPLPGAHAMKCAICIGAVAFAPSAIIFALLRRGACVRPFQAGSFAVLAATAIGCLTLRLAEANDSMMHLVSWHYLPTLLFTILGAFIGRYLLKW
jgi:hypothetical protein